MDDVRRAAILRIKNRWPDPSLITRTSCTVCAPIGDGCSYDFDLSIPEPWLDARAQAIESALAPVIAGSWLRECITCGALFTRNQYKEPAADQLLGGTVEITRVSPEEAMRSLGGP